MARNIVLYTMSGRHGNVNGANCRTTKAHGYRDRFAKDRSPSVFLEHC